MTGTGLDHNGYSKYNIWQHSRSVTELYTQRARDQAEEMTCAAQAADLLATVITPGDSLLDIGCGTGWFYHSLRRRQLDMAYYAIDANPDFIQIAQKELPSFGLSPGRIQCLRIEDLDASMDHVLCMNVLSNIDNYHRPLERLLKTARKTLLLRESIKDGAEYHYVTDHYLNDGVELKVHVNAYDRKEIMAFIRSYGFEVEEILDQRTQGQAELVIDHAHYWTFLKATKVLPE